MVAAPARVWVLALGAGCSASSAPRDGGADACALAIAAGSDDGHGFVPLEDEGEAEIVLGFQGSLFLDLVLRVEGTDAAEGHVGLQADVEGLETSWISQTVVLEGDGGARYARDVQLFFNAASLADLLGRRGTFRFGVAAGGCSGTQDLDLVLVDEESCVQQPDGGFACADGG